MRAHLVRFQDASGESAALAEVTRILTAAAWSFGHELTFDVAPLDRSGVAACRDAAAALVAPSAGFSGVLTELRRSLELHALARPLRSFPALGRMPMDPPVLRVVPQGTSLRAAAMDLLVVSEHGLQAVDEPAGAPSAAVLAVACQLARRRWGLMTALDAGAAVEIPGAFSVARAFPELSLSRESVDVAARTLPDALARYDVVATTPPCARWLCDETALLPGSVGACVEASFGAGTFGLYQPTAGAARASVGAALCAAMVLRHSLGLGREASAVESAAGLALAACAAGRPLREELCAAICDSLSGGWPTSQAI